ncbi:reticulocyte binding protein, putative [Plasmodium chabaudi chabaudi]|uniref:Reticulocyte binding protein, putative n=1 Tax=Plasmodium chabaudi chabaudi TaxID=31271 RepID=A0A1C6WA55_PLACU|nr:reticulocyte binding protein, putative [Plasmodium chabaudi chabaudi]
MMKKIIYITTTYIILFISSEIICGQLFGENTSKHGKQLNDFNPNHNFKKWGFNKSHSSNEEQDNNQHDASNDENNGEFDSINIESFENKDNAQNTQYPLYNEPKNKKYLASLKNVSHGNEQANKKVTIAKNLSIPNFNVPEFDSSLFNVTDIIYGSNVVNENISFVYVKLRTLEELRGILYKFYIDKYNELKDVIGDPEKIKNEINEIFKKHQSPRDKVINEMTNLHNPLYNFYNKPSMDNYKLYTSSQKKYVKDLISALKKVESQIEKYILSMSNTYEDLGINKLEELKEIIKNYTNDTIDHNKKILDSIKDRSFLDDNKTIPFIEFLIDTLNSEKKLQTIKNKLIFLLNQFKDIRERYVWHRLVCNNILKFLNSYKAYKAPHLSKEYFDNFRTVTSKLSIIIYNNDRLSSLEKLDNYLKEVLFQIFKMLGKLLIDTPDPQNNLKFKDDIYEFDTSTPKSKFTLLKNKFVEIFKNEWEFNNNKTIEGDDSINNNMILISNYMDKFKILIDSMESSQKNGFEEKNKVLDEISNKLDKNTYEERKEGFTSSLELAKQWETKKTEILTKLNKENDETVQLEKKINELFKKCSDIIAERKYVEDLKLELNKKIKGMSDKKEYIKKAIDLDKEIKEKVVYIEELSKQSPYKIDKYIEQKDTICNIIKSEFDQIYVGDTNKLYTELSSIVEENAIDSTEDKTQLEALTSKINDKYNNIQSMGINTDASHLNIVNDNKNTLLKTILESKKYIYDEINNELNKMLDNFKNKETNLLSNISDYSKHNDELSKYKTTISEIRNKYNEKVNIANIQEEETREIYEKSKEYMTKISANEDEILKNINEVKYMKTKFLDKVNAYIKFDNNYKENVDSEHNQFITLTNKIDTDVSRNELSKYGQKLDDSKALIDQTNKYIEEEYQNINTLKKANEYIKVCKNTTELIKNFRNKHSELSEILNKNIETIKDTTSIKKSYTDNFLNTLTNKKNEFDKIFIDASLNDYEQTNNKLEQYFNSLIENLGKNPENTQLQQFNENEKAVDDIKQKNEHMDKNISNIEKAIYTSIHNINEEIENEIGKNIELLNTQVLEKVTANATNLNQIKEKLKLYNFDDFGEEGNIKYADEITKIKDDIETLNKKIDEKIETLTEIKKKSEGYIDEIKTQIDKSENAADKNVYNDDPKEIDKKIKNIVEKIDKKKNIHEDINKLLNKISEIESDKTALDKVKDINVSYGKSLSTLFLEKISEEEKKSKDMTKSIETYIEDLDNIKNKSNGIQIEMGINGEALKILHDEDKKYHNINKENEKYFLDIHEKSLKLKNDISGTSNINDIKKELQLNVANAQNHNDEINHYLKKISNIYNILKSNSIQNIVDKVIEYTNKIEENNKNIKNELDKTQTLVNTLNNKLDLKACKSKLESTIDDKDIDDCINKITDLKNFMLNEEDNLNTCYKNSEGYNKIALLNFKNIEMTDIQSQYILATKSDLDTHNHDYNINKLKEHKDKSITYKNEIDNNIKTLEENKKSFEQYKQETTVLLNKYSALALKNKFDKTKKDSEFIIKEIKDAHNNCISQAEKYEQKMSIIKNEQVRIDDSNANNDKSNKAIIGIQASLEKFETRLLKINEIRKKSNDCLKETENIEKQISSLSINSQDTELKNNEIKLDNFKKILSSLKDKKKHIEDQAKELNEVNSQIENIESDVNKYKKDYEIGIIEKIYEIFKVNKDQIESTKELINPTIQNIISSFNTNDLEGIDTNANLEKYNTEMNDIYEEFNKSYNIMKNCLETVSKEPIEYDLIKNTRIIAQNELLKNIESKEKAKSYLDDAKVNEFDRIATYFHNQLNALNDKFNNEYLKINEGFDNISKYIDNVKNSTDENLLLDILNQTKQEYSNIIRKTYYSYKYEAENIFLNISKLANSLNIQIQNSSGINLFRNTNIGILSYLDSNTEDTLTFIPSSLNKLETYTKIHNSYNALLNIFKKSQDLHKKEHHILNLMFENRRLYEKVHVANELKGILSDIIYKKENILNDVKLVLGKSNELNQILLNYQNYDTILEPSKYDQIKTKIDNYEQEKDNLGINFNVTTVEEKLDSIIKSIEELGNNYDSSEENTNLLQYKKKQNDLTKAFNTEIKTTEDKVIEKNNLIDKLIEMRKDCLLFMNTTLVETFKNKSTDYSEFITSATKFSKEFLKYIDDTSNFLNDDIDALQTKYNLNLTSKHVISKYADATNDNNDLIEKEKEATQAINNLTKLFSIDLQNVDDNTLYNNNLQMIYFDSEAQKSIEHIRQLYKKMQTFKLSSIDHINEKYFDISKLFDNIIQSQKNKLTENLNNLKEIEQYISDEKNNFLHIRKESINPNFNTLKEIHNNIIARESQIHEIENISSKENDNITLYVDSITKLMEKIENILNYVTSHENDHNITNQDIQDNDENHVSKVKDNLKNTIQSFQQIQEEINETKTQFYDNDTINDIKTTISQNINDVKTHFSKDLTIESELTHIQYNLSDIKNASYESQSNQIANYANTIQNYIEEQNKKIGNNTNINEIDNTIKQIINYNNESETKLEQISNHRKHVSSITTDIINLLTSIKSEYNYNNTLFNDAIKHEEDSHNLIYDLNKSRNILNNLIRQNKKTIEKLGYKKENIQNRNNLHTINRQQEIKEKKHASNTHQNDTNDVKYKTQNSSDSDQDNTSKPRNIISYMKYAGVVALGFVTGYVINKFRKKNETNETNETKETDLEETENVYDTMKSRYYKRGEEIAEINMNED